MANQVKDAAVAAQAVENANVNAEQAVVDTTAATTSIFDTLASDDTTSEVSREDIVADLLKRDDCKILKGLHIRNVVVGQRVDGSTDDNTPGFLTFCVREYVFGDTFDATNLDAFGQPTRKLGRTHNVQTSVYAVSGLMKDDAREAIFAADVVANPAKANMLFAGGTCDVIMQYVKAGSEYTNPFATNAEAVTFDTDKMIHHVVKLNMGEVGKDLYNAMLMK